MVAVDNEDEDDDMGDNVGATKTPAIQLAPQRVTEPPSYRIVAPPQAPTGSSRQMAHWDPNFGTPSGKSCVLKDWISSAKLGLVESHASTQTEKAWQIRRG